MSGPSEHGGRRAAPARELTADHALLLEVIASVADAVAVYAANGDEQWARVKWPVAGDARDAELRGRMRELAQSASATDLPERGAAPTPQSLRSGIVRDIALGGGSYRLRAVRLRPGFFGSDASVLVVGERLREEPPTKQGLLERFRLTAREADVALLLAERRSNAEIAQALGISPHTARRHTEQVLLKVGAKKRHDVGRVLRQLGCSGSLRSPGEPCPRAGPSGEGSG